MRKRSLVERYDVLRDAFSEYHLNKFNVSFEFKLISMVVLITTLLIQAKENKSHKSAKILVLTPVMSIDEFMFPPDTAQSVEGNRRVVEHFYPSFLRPTWRHSFVTRKVRDRKIADDFKRHVSYHS